MSQIAGNVKDDYVSQPQILVMEDENSVAQGLQMILREEGYGVDLAMTGQGALDTFSHKGFDLLVADLRLPDMDGMDVIKQVKDENPETEVIVITGYANVSSAVEAMKNGVADYISKPFTEAEFIQRVDKALKERKKAFSEEYGESQVVDDEIDEPTIDDSVSQPQILVMEDEPSVAQGLQMILEEEGYEVDLAMTGKSALNTLNHKGFDLLVADLRLPDMDGMDIVKKVKEQKPETKIIAMTGYSSVFSAADVRKAGVSDYLSKPFTEEEFLATVVSTMKERQETISEEMMALVDDETVRESKIGFYICHGGNDISDKVRVDDIIEFAGKQPNVLVARGNKYLCQ